MKTTRVLLVTGVDDFNALEFENAHGGMLVSDIIEDLTKYENEDRWDLEILVFGEIDPKFVKFIKTRIQDYDDSKNTNFYLETDTI